MTEHADCGDIRQALGVYVVGAIDPAERVVVDAHLTHCQGCREELAALAGLPALLRRVPVEDAERLVLDGADVTDLAEPPAEMLDSLLRQVTARRHAHRWRGVLAAAAAAVVAVGGGIGGGMLISHGRPPARPPVTAPAAKPPIADLVKGSNPDTRVTAAVYYLPRKSGTEMQVQVSGIRDGTRCQFWLTTFGGQHVLVGRWTVNGSQGNWYGASSTVATSQVRSFDIASGGKVLVTVKAT